MNSLGTALSGMLYRRQRWPEVFSPAPQTAAQYQFCWGTTLIPEKEVKSRAILYLEMTLNR